MHTTTAGRRSPSEHARWSILRPAHTLTGALRVLNNLKRDKCQQDNMGNSLGTTGDAHMRCVRLLETGRITVGEFGSDRGPIRL